MRLGLILLLAGAIQTTAWTTSLLAARVRRPMRLDFHGTHQEARIIRGGELDHAQAICGAGNGRVAVHRLTGGDEQDAGKFERFGSLLGNSQVAVVDRIEYAAEYAPALPRWLVSHARRSPPAPTRALLSQF